MSSLTQWDPYQHKDYALRLWDLETGHCLRTLEGHTGYVESVCVCPDGRHALSKSEDKTLRVWDLETGTCLRTLEGHTSSVNSICMTPDGRSTVSGSRDQTLRLWDLETGACLAVYHAGTAIRDVTLHTAGDRIICGTEDGQLHFLTPVNILSGPPVVTAVRLWHFDESAQPGHWDDNRTVQCPWCGRRFPVRDDQLGHQITCPLEGCCGEMQLNAFVAGGMQ